MFLSTFDTRCELKLKEKKEFQAILIFKVHKAIYLRNAEMSFKLTEIVSKAQTADLEKLRITVVFSA